MSTKAQIRASMNYNKKMDYFGLRPSPEEGKLIRAAAAAAGMSNQAYILEAIREKMNRETVSPGPEMASGALSPPGGTDSTGTPESASGDE